MKSGRLFQQFWLTSCAVVFAVLENTNNDVAKPRFDTATRNVTAVAGETAILPCMVENLENLKKYKVVWMSPEMRVLSEDDRRLFNDDRMSVERPFVEDWNLHIRAVRHEDEGAYKCTLNTNPVLVKNVILTVHVAPDIIEELSSENQIVREGAKVTLHCNATGEPTPVIRWYRKTSLAPDGEKETIGRAGETLIIHNISRYCDGTYECIADNGIASPASKEITVAVHFMPEVRVLNPRMSQTLGRETILSCIVSASPQARAYWRKGDVKMDTTYGKYRSEIYRDSPHTIQLNLQIIDVQLKDFGYYTCEASNILGRDSQTMLLYEFVEPTERTTEKVYEVMESGHSVTKRPSFNDQHKPLNIPNYGAMGLNRNGSQKFRMCVQYLVLISCFYSLMASTLS